MSSRLEYAYTLVRQAGAFAGSKPNGWNRRYLSEIRRSGFDIIPVTDNQKFDMDDIIFAPEPNPHDTESTYPYPSVIAPKGWEPVKTEKIKERNKMTNENVSYMCGYPVSKLKELALAADDAGIDNLLRTYYEKKCDEHRLLMLQYEEKLKELKK